MKSIFAFALILVSASPAAAEEGMWTFDHPPLQQLERVYRFTPSSQWLDHVRLASVRLNNGGSGSFVSPNGLLLTNHHVAEDQLQKASTAAHDYLRNGFYAATPEAEIKSAGMEVNVLISTENVTSRVLAATKSGGSAERQFAERNATIAAIGRESTAATGLRSDVVTLYQGGEYWLYRYKRYTDLRLVFAPEKQIAYFGGDADNFTFPRHSLDMAFFRVYENGRPLDSKNYLKWNPLGVKAGNLTLVAGHPGATHRLATMAQLTMDRDLRTPALIRLTRSRIDALERFTSVSPAHAREAEAQLASLGNALKFYEGRYLGMLDPHLIAIKQKEEDDFRARVNANPALQREFGSAWDDIAGAERNAASLIKRQYFQTTNSQWAGWAASLVDYAAEIAKPDGERLAGYHDSQLASLKFNLLAAAPIDADLEIARMSAALELALAELGPQDPFVKISLDGKTPTAAAAMWVGGSKLADPAARKRLLDGGTVAIAASTDSLIVLQRRVDPLRREILKWFDANVQSIEQSAGERLGKARFAVYGGEVYPDATFTLRLSYGRVAGYTANGTQTPPMTTFYGLYDRATSFNFEGPFALPPRVLDAKDKLDLATPLNFATTNDIIGGNSGSPVINRAGEIVGLIFDGNLESLAGDFVYDGAANRAVAVASGAMTEALRKIYGAQKLVDEILAGK